MIENIYLRITAVWHQFFLLTVLRFTSEHSLKANNTFYKRHELFREKKILYAKVATKGVTKYNM
jgi:hypothetical protein